LNDKPRIFLCHAHEDKPRVIELYHQLTEAGYSPWLDKYDLLGGLDWWTEIEKIISDPYNLVVVCLSCNSVTKRGVVQQEIARALDVLEQMPEDTIYAIPVRLEPCDVPRRLTRLHWIDIFEADGFEKLTRSLDFEIAKRQPPLDPSLEPELILIPAGEFLMGSDPNKDRDAKDSEQPQHTVYLPEYYIAKTPVTNAQYAAFVETTVREPPRHWEAGKRPAGKENHPVVQINWHDATAYCRWLAKVTGKPYGLPSEAEWEKAARGGLHIGSKDNPYPDRIYPWGDQWDPKRCNSREGGPGDTTPVGRYSPQGDSPYGCADMAGNVWEWTLSLDREYPYEPKDGREDPQASGLRVLRGGAFYNARRDVHCAYRLRLSPYYGSHGFGFRVVLAPGL